MTATYCNDGPIRELDCIGVEITDELRERLKYTSLLRKEIIDVYNRAYDHWCAHT